MNLNKKKTLRQRALGVFKSMPKQHESLKENFRYIETKIARQNL